MSSPPNQARSLRFGPFEADLAVNKLRSALGDSVGRRYVEPFPVQDFHEAGSSMPLLSELAVARDKLVFDLTESRGNIWMMEPVEK